MADDFISGALAGQQFQLNKFLLAEAPVELEQKKFALKVAETDYDKRQQMAKLLAGSPTPIPDDRNPLTQASQTLVKTGAAAAQAGLPEEAIEYFSKASTIASQQETAAYHKWQETKQRSDFADKILAQVHDEASWKQANDYIELATGKPSAMKDKPYSPELVQALKDASTAHRTQAQEALTREQAKRTKLEEQLDAERVPLLKAQTALAEAREKNARKVGTGAIPNSKTVAAMSDFIVKEYGDANVSPTDARVFARNLAPEVEEAMDKEHKTQSQAVASVFQKAKDRGDLAGVSPAHIRPGQSMKKPMPLPANKTDPKAYKDQMWYDVGGEPRYYDAETQRLYKAGEGPESNDEDEE
jgi:hypothetical protein